MDANKLWMLRDFIGTNKVLFKIPVYQRNYDWSESNCNRLLDDVYSIIKTDDKHFLGTIVFMAAKSGGFSLQEYIIIDGQQRLTTMMLLLKALADVAKNSGDDCYHEIEEQYLHNKYCDEEYKVKLKPIKSDNDQFLKLLNDNIDDMDEETHVYKNYIICKDRFESWGKRGITPSEILYALTKLEIVEIVLTKGEDDPQVIFESINSTGLELSNSDLIRNFLLMDADNQEKLYENYWLPIEKSLKNKTDYSNLDDFFLQYVIYKINKSVSSKQLYNTFVELFKKTNCTQEDMLIDLKYYSEIFSAFIYGSKKYSDRVNKLLMRLRLLKQTTCYPFLMHVFNDYNNKVIDETELEKVLQLILAYLLRRLVCGVPSNSLRSFFMFVYNRIFKVTRNKSKYYESINKFLFTLLSKDAMPSLSEFERALQKSNLYSNGSLCRFLLLDIENGDDKETLNPSSLTIEHIMPQKLSADWNYISQEEHEEYLHTLGNLSVTGYNSELSNKSFKEKREIIKDSKAVVLNKDVIDKDTWTIDDIKQRAKRMASIIMDRYKIEQVVDDSIEFEYVDILTLSDLGKITNSKLVSFKFFGETYRQNTYCFMLLDVVKLINKKDPGSLENLAKIGYSFSTTKKKHPHINTDGQDMRRPYKVLDNVYVETNLSSESCVQFINYLFDEFRLDKSQFSFNIVAEESSDSEDDE